MSTDLMVNSIVWSNSPDQIGNSYIDVTYSSIQYGWPGIGNIADDPMFIAPEYYDFRLQWGSPCIDAGDPDPQYNDPDGTRADIGPFYYDQSVPVRILMIPHERSIVIPTEGGSFDYTINLTCIDPEAPHLTTWIDVTLPDGTVFGPLMGPIEAELDSGITVNRVRTQNVPSGAERGLYSYNAYAIAGTDTSFDSFSFFKIGADGSDWTKGWVNRGESFDNLGEASFVSTLPQQFTLDQNYPNPFNPFTTISFTLPETGKVNLSVFDISGRLVATLADGWRDAGTHEVTFDGSDLASGIYAYRLEAGEYMASGKMVLVK